MKDYGLKYKAMFMTVYGGGLRVSELCNLRIQDIDSENMRILVREGKQVHMKIYVIIVVIKKLVIIHVEIDIVQSAKHQQKKNGYIIKNLMY